MYRLKLKKNLFVHSKMREFTQKSEKAKDRQAFPCRNSFGKVRNRKLTVNS